jgi:hypothetical protein
VALEVSALSIDFGEVPVGSAAHVDLTVTLLSPGPAFFTAAIEPDGPPFLIADELSSTLSTDGTITLPLAFQPTDLGDFIGVLALEVDAVDAITRVDVSLRGRGVDGVRDADRDGIPEDEDCDDQNPAVFPGATEICDGVDNDCDGSLPLDEQDRDGDGFTPCNGDCDDDEDTVYPIAPEYCDGLDNNCDGDLEESDDDLDG